MGKKQRDAAARYDRVATYTPAEALSLVKALAHAGFDETVEAAFNLGIDARQADQIVRGTVTLPHGTGKSVRVLVFADGEKARDAQAAGADIVGGAELAQAITAGQQALDWDVTIAAPAMMAEVGKLGRLLGPRGLMPNPKAGTVVPAEDLPRVIRESKAGRVEFRVDKTSNLHVPVGKVSFDAKMLYENLAALMEAVKKARPSSMKGIYIKRITLTATMGPGIKIDPAGAQSMEVTE